MSPRTKAQNEQIRRERREQILEAARQVFVERGFHATRMSDVARAAGVSQGTVYHYFDNKDDLFIALLNVWNDQLEEIVKSLPETELKATNKFWLINQVGVSFMEINTDLLSVLVEFWAYALHNPQAAASFRRFFQAMQQTFADILNEGIASGEFKAIDVEDLSALPLIVLDGVILLTAVVGKDLINPERVMKKTQQLIFEGLLTEAKGARP
jgi:AcrR family transcriptional regulator